MLQFKIKETGFDEIRKRILVRTIPMVLLCVIALFVIVGMNSAGSVISSLIILAFILLIIIGFVAYTIRISLKLQESFCDSYLLQIDEEGLTHQQENTSDLHLHFSQILKVIKSADGLLIEGPDELGSIVVPPQVEGYAEIETLLAGKFTLEIAPSKFFVSMLFVSSGFMVLGLMAVTFLVRNCYLVAISGSILMAIMGVGFVVIQKNTHVDAKTKRKSIWMIFAILGLLAVVVSKFFVRH